MRKLFVLLLCVTSVFAFTGCGEKSTEEKAADALEEARDDAVKAAKDAEKEASEGMDALMND